MTRDSDGAQRAAEWVNRLDQPTIDTAASAAFDDWMRDDARNRDDFADIQALWHSDMLTTALRGVADGEAQAAAASRWRVMIPWMGAAACAVLAVVLLLPILLTTTYRTGRGDGERIALSDGTQIALSGEAELRVRMLPWRRDATLAQGEAFFDVAHDADRPFHVESGNATVRVLGTAFNVDRQGATRTVVEVYRGAVAVAAADTAPLVLRKGDRTRVLGDSVQSPTGTRKVAGPAPDWTSGWFEANDVPLAVLVAKVQRYSARTIRLQGKGIATLPVSGRFRIAQPERALRAIEAAYDLDVQQQGDAILIAPATQEAN